MRSLKKFRPLPKHVALRCKVMICGISLGFFCLFIGIYYKVFTFDKTEKTGALESQRGASGLGAANTDAPSVRSCCLLGSTEVTIDRKGLLEALDSVRRDLTPESPEVPESRDEQDIAEEDAGNAANAVSYDEDESAPTLFDSALRQRSFGTIRAKLIEKTEANLLPSRVQGPYAPLLHDLLEETSINSQLTKFGFGPVFLSNTGDSVNRESLLNALPACLPTYGYVSSGFGFRRSPFSRRLVMHRGIDFSVPLGSEVVATGDGLVTFAGWHGALGRLVEIDHGHGIVTRYGHNQKLVVAVGDQVVRGQSIARAGSSGRSTGPHVHFEVWLRGQPIDPSTFMFSLPDHQFSLARLDAGATSSPNLAIGMGGEEPVTANFRSATANRQESASMQSVEVFFGSLWIKNLAICGAFLLTIISLLRLIYRAGASSPRLSIRIINR